MQQQTSCRAGQPPLQHAAAAAAAAVAHHLVQAGLLHCRQAAEVLLLLLQC
jgi:hypothetical protein